ncbi:hypothetical protein CAPTEDRAFT_220466 [Capitella teleta]|uniref:Uncharacterized protein n=1 Tax=Capitella teleta TaxID=283909 RepID=R7TCI8_CAPTE|nr:hypothetical protein CAPTEDRAFT_220466 [Capitella teleta]|eukprot:ELT91443.1 hypothetical protein CAPTEDRAFT_220466 [Capitella teleta]
MLTYASIATESSCQAGMEPARKARPFASLVKAPTQGGGLTEDSAQSLPTFQSAATSMNNPFVQIPLSEYHRLVARLENVNRGDDSMKNLNTVIENLKVDLENHKDKAAKYETAFLEAELHCGYLIKASLGRQDTKSICESVVPSISTENPSIATEKLISNLVSENHALKEQMDKILQKEDLDYVTFKEMDRSREASFAPQRKMGSTKSIKAAETEVEQLRKSLNEEKVKCQELLSLQELRTSRDADDQLRVRCTELTQQVWKLTKTSNAKQALITAISTERSRVTALADSLRNELGQSKRDLAIVKSEKEKLKEENDKLHERLRKILSKTTGAKDMDAELERQHQKERMAQLQDQIKRQQRENEKLHADLKAAKSEENKAKTDLKQFREYWETLQKTLIGSSSNVVSRFERSEMRYGFGQDLVTDSPGSSTERPKSGSSASGPSRERKGQKSKDKPLTSSEKPKCPRCGKAFKSLELLQEHCDKCLEV